MYLSPPPPPAFLLVPADGREDQIKCSVRKDGVGAVVITERRGHDDEHNQVK